MSKKLRRLIRLRLTDETLEAIAELQTDYARKTKAASGSEAKLSFDQAIAWFMMDGVELWRARKGQR